jgi:hypothetical protein
MKTKENLSTAHSIQVTLDIPVPDNIPFRFSSHEVRAAFDNVLLENLHIMRLVFENLIKCRQEVGQLPNSPLPRISKAQKDQKYSPNP